MNFRRILMYLLISSTIACEEIHRDDFEISDPDPLTVKVVYPNLAQFTITQGKPRGQSQAAPVVNNSIWVKRLDGVTGEIKFLVRLFKGSPFTADNMGLFAIRQSAGDETIDLGQAYTTPLIDANAEVKVITTGDAIVDALVGFGGYYKGTYILSNGATQVAAGIIEGYIDYKGDFQLELTNYPGFRFLKGNGIQGDTENDFAVNAALLDSVSTSVATTQEVFTKTNTKLDTELSFVSADFTTLEIKLIKQ